MKLGFEAKDIPGGGEVRSYWIQMFGRKVGVPRWLYRLFDPKN